MVRVARHSRKPAIEATRMVSYLHQASDCSGEFSWPTPGNMLLGDG